MQRLKPKIWSISIIIIFIFISLVFLMSNFYFRYMGRRHYSAGNYTKSIKMYNNILIDKTMSYEDWVNKGISETNLENYEEAIHIFNKIEFDYTDTTTYLKDIYYNKGIAYYKISEFEKCIDNMEKYLELENIPVLIEIASPYLINSYFKLRDYNKCLQSIDYFLQHTSGNNVQYEVQLYNYQYNSYFKLEEFEHAINSSKKLISLDPANINHYLGLYLVYQRTEDEGFINNYLKSIQNKFPDNEQLKKILNN